MPPSFAAGAERSQELSVKFHDHDSTAERVAKNDARFRQANEELATVADELGMGREQLLPFLCECADMSCTQIVRLSVDEYESVRQNPVRFINARGHEESAHGWVQVVDEFDRYTVVDKVGEAGRIAAELDPREAEAQ